MKTPWKLIDMLGFNRLARSLHLNEGWLLLYGHGVSRADFELNVEGNHLPVDIFAAHLEHVLSLGFRFIGMSEGLDRLKRGLPMRRLATVTFDDGFANVVEQAYPVMASLNAKGCTYVVAGCVGSNDPLWPDKVAVVIWENRGRGDMCLEFPDGSESFDLSNDTSTITSIKRIKERLRRMPEPLRHGCFQQFEELFRRIPAERIPQDYRLATWDQLRKLDPEILEIGNHSYSHPNLTKVEDHQELEREIVGSKRLIEDALGQRVRHFCYPFGPYNASIIKLVRDAGHESGISTMNGINEAGCSEFELRRQEMTRSSGVFRARISGVADCLYRLRHHRSV